MNWIKTIPFVAFLIIIGLIITRIIVLKKRGIQVTSGSKKFTRKILVLYTSFFLILLLWTLELANNIFFTKIKILPEIFTKLNIQYQLLQITGILLILIALLILLLTLLHFKTSLRFGMDKNNRGELITEGIFSVSRNPFFLSLDFYFIGIALIFPSWFFIGFSLLAVISIHFFILKEERFLKEVYDDEYNTYSEKVRRYL